MLGFESLGNCPEIVGPSNVANGLHDAGHDSSFLRWSSDNFGVNVFDIDSRFGSVVNLGKGSVHFTKGMLSKKLASNTNNNGSKAQPNSPSKFVSVFFGIIDHPSEPEESSSKHWSNSNKEYNSCSSINFNQQEGKSKINE